MDDSRPAGRGGRRVGDQPQVGGDGCVGAPLGDRRAEEWTNAFGDS